MNFLLCYVKLIQNGSIFPKISPKNSYRASKNPIYPWI